MLSKIFKVCLSAGVIVLVSELASRFPRLGALLLMILLSFRVFTYRENLEASGSIQR